MQPEQVVPCNENDVIDDLGKGEPKEVFLGHFRRYLKKGIHDAAPFKKIEFAAPISDSGFTETPLRLSKDDNLTIVLPSPGISVRFDSVEADFVLFFSKIITSRYDGENGGIDGFTRFNYEKDGSIVFTMVIQTSKIVNGSTDWRRIGPHEIGHLFLDIGMYKSLTEFYIGLQEYQNREGNNKVWQAGNGHWETQRAKDFAEKVAKEIDGFPSSLFKFLPKSPFIYKVHTVIR